MARRLRHLLCLLGAFTALPLSAAEDPETIPRSGHKFELLKFKPIPRYAPRQQHDGSYEVLSRKDVVGELRLSTGVHFNERGNALLPPPQPRISLRYEFYSAIDDDWFATFNDWFHRELDKLDLRYRKESWDCDDFSMALNAFADLALLLAEEHPPPQLIGRMLVQQVHAWAGTPAGGIHEVVIFRSGTAWHVVEPQNRTMCALLDYPNRHTIREILFN